jgi:hypothetical protein
LVERDLAKVEVAGSSPVFRSGIPSAQRDGIFYLKAYPGGGTGRRAGLKILSAEMRVRVRFPSRVRIWFSLLYSIFFCWYYDQELSTHFSIRVFLKCLLDKAEFHLRD